MAKAVFRLYATKALIVLGTALLGLKKGVEVFLRLLGPIFFCLGFALISYAVYVHYTFVLPWFSGYPAFSWNLFSLVHNLVGVWLSLGIAYNYAKSALTPALNFSIELSPAEIAVMNASEKNVSSRKNARFCKYCQKGKINRMHHCHICKACVPGMDHHCPWIGNCVGFHNHHYFILFLLYLLAGCVYASTMSFYPFVLALDTGMPWPYTTTRSSVVFSFILAVAVAGSLFFLAGWQLYCMLTGQTSVEYYIHRELTATASEFGRTYRNPNDHGWAKNFQVFFGVDPTKPWFAWLVPGMSNPVHTPASVNSASARRRTVENLV